MSAMDDMLASMVKKAIPKEMFDKIETVAVDVSKFIIETRAQLDRIEGKLERIGNVNSDNSDGRTIASFGGNNSERNVGSA